MPQNSKVNRSSLGSMYYTYARVGIEYFGYDATSEQALATYVGSVSTPKSLCWFSSCRISYWGYYGLSVGTLWVQSRETETGNQIDINYQIS